MTISVKNSGSWVVPSHIYVKDSGAWEEANQIWVRQGGVWYQMLTTLAVSSSTTDFNLFTSLGSPTTPITARIEINSGVTLSSTSTSNPAFSISGFATGSVIYLVNNGSIIGAGGAGGGRVAGTGPAAKFGLPGGAALYTRNTLKLTNNGTIASGGGGGGGGGRTNRSGQAFDDFTGAGGGGAGAIVGAGGPGIPDNLCSTTGVDGTATNGGAGVGYCSSPASSEQQIGSVGGAGGNLGKAGSRGEPAPDFDGTNLGGVAGNAIDGISYTTKTVAGTITGPEVN